MANDKKLLLDTEKSKDTGLQFIQEYPTILNERQKIKFLYHIKEELQLKRSISRYPTNTTNNLQPTTTLRKNQTHSRIDTTANNLPNKIIHLIKYSTDIATDIPPTKSRVHFTKFEEFENYVKMNTQKKNNKSMTNSKQIKLSNLFTSNSQGLKQTKYENNLVNFIVNNMKSLSITENKDFQKLILENRHFSVRSGFSLSEVSPIHAGVPQGSVTAPLLFNLFTSDQPTTPNTTIGDFADDKALLAIHSDPEIASNLVQNHLNLLSTWYKDWRIKINETKSIHYTFTLRQIVCPPIFLNNVPLPTAQNVRYLGLHLDRRLTWATHTHNKRLALNNRSRQLRYLLTSQHLNLKNKLLLYKLLLKPIWTYGIQLWGAAKKSNLNKIQIFQSKCLRQITKAPYFVSNDTLHKDLAIPTVQNVAKTFYKRTHSKFHSHRNPLITELSINTIPGDPRRRLKRTWCRDLLI
ncbi:Reverse transcriptase domain [Cinara cedri]|uniref:Reverse transcriptase domain n=1 Tax=Cinara cedri TaxID=506608 RepID=A0A5E4MU85_9HEMI|nr:Reverse transcriptase domain [Cinara cedri]